MKSKVFLGALDARTRGEDVRRPLEGTIVGAGAAVPGLPGGLDRLAQAGETEAREAASACGRALGLGSPADHPVLWPEGRRFLPSSPSEPRERLRSGGPGAAERAKGGAEEA